MLPDENRADTAFRLRDVPDKALLEGVRGGENETTIFINKQKSKERN